MKNIIDTLHIISEKIRENFMFYQDNADRVKNLVESYGFHFIAMSTRVLVKCEDSQKFYKLDTKNLGDGSIEDSIYKDLVKDGRYADYFVRVKSVAETVVETDFLEGISVYDLEDNKLAETVMFEVNCLLRKIRNDLKIDFDDIEDYNVIYNPQLKEWKIFDYAT